MDDMDKPKKSRSMIKADLHGRHQYETANGVKIIIVQRDGQYLARGRLFQKAFAVTLGRDHDAAFEKLCELKVEIANGRFLRHSERKRQPLNPFPPEKLTLSDLCARQYLGNHPEPHGHVTAIQAVMVLVVDFSSACPRGCWWTRRR